MREQHRDLAASLGELLADIFAGRKRLKVYRQFKMYNDPAMNPYLYAPNARRREMRSFVFFRLPFPRCSLIALRGGHVYTIET